jgi:ATP-dependent exoDNAse (exonuclease V) alpha subunit
MTAEETRLYPFLMTHNEQVRQINADALRHYPAPTYPLEAEICFVPQLQAVADWEIRNEDRVRQALVKSLGLLEQTTHVRIGTPVMFTSNDSDGRFVNGTRGFVRAVNLLPRSREQPEDMDNVVVGVPSMNPDEPEKTIVIGRQSYSRAREQDPYQTVAVPLGFNNEFGTMLPPSISRYPTIRQFPLIPATAVTIHKAQGTSLDSAIMALASSFAAGQVYVGLSRLRSPAGLVLSEADFQVKTDPYVMEFYRSIQEQNARVPN